MKKLNLVIAILCIALGLSAQTMASSPELFNIDPPNIVTLTKETETIPVYGFIADNSEAIDLPPSISVELPLRLMFAAFEYFDGLVTGPRHQVRNLSTTHDISISIESFEQTDKEVTELNELLKLHVLDKEGSLIVDHLFPGDFTENKVLVERLAKYVDDETDTSFAFSIGGIWSGGFSEILKPSFEMTLRFSIID